MTLLKPTPIVDLELDKLPRHALLDGGIPPDAAAQAIRDELMLDGNAQLNLATFVTTWMEPQARALMEHTLDKNMIDKDEYPQTAALEMRCVNILSDLWHAPKADVGTGCSTTGSSEAAMLAGLALKRRWQHARAAAGKPADKPNIVMGINVQVCWEKFANYWDVEMRLVPMEGERFTLNGEEAVALCDENTIGVVTVLGSTFDGAYEPVAEIAEALDELQERDGSRRPAARRRRVRWVRRAVHRPGPRVGLPHPTRALDQRVGPQVRARLPGRRVVDLARRQGAARGPHLPRELPRRRHADVRAELLAARARRSSAQYYNFLRLGFDGYARPGLRPRRRHAARRRDRGARPVRPDHPRRRAPGVRIRAERRRRRVQRLRRLARMRERGWQLPAVHVPGEPHRSRRPARRGPQRGFTHDMADMLVEDLKRQLPHLERQGGPLHDESTTKAFKH